jgi:hypothetical protein
MAGTVVIERSQSIRVGAATLIPYIRELPRWTGWSPWEGVDPDMRRDYSGEAGAIGSSYRWSGNRKAGEGSMEIVSASEDEVRIALTFTRPFRSNNVIRFLLAADGDGTRVTWRMESPKTFFSRLFNMDKLVGRDFEKGLAALRALVETA